MRARVVAVGVLMMIVGALLSLLAFLLASNRSSLDGLLPDTMIAYGGVIGLIGFVLLIVGLVAKRKSGQAVPSATPASSRSCPSRGVGNASAALFCQKCGRPLPPPA